MDDNSKIKTLEYELKKITNEHTDSMIKMTEKLNKEIENNKNLKIELNKKNSLLSKCDAQVSKLSSKLVDMQNNGQNERDKIREEESKKLKKGYDEEINQWKLKYDQANADKENAQSEKKELKKKLDAIVKKVHEEIDKGILEKSAVFDYTPEILKECDKIDETVGGSMQKLDSIFQTLGEFDDRSQQRLYCTVQTLQNSIEKIDMFLGQKPEDMNNITQDNILNLNENALDTGLNLK